MDVVADTMNHINTVSVLLHRFCSELILRGSSHDASKLESPEREMYETWRPKLDSLDIESAEYKVALSEMGEGLRHHYSANRHHPEHFEDGLRGMNLVDVIEMVCDWKAAAIKNHKPVNMEWACNRFGISKDEALYSIIANTLDVL